MVVLEKFLKIFMYNDDEELMEEKSFKLDDSTDEDADRNDADFFETETEEDLGPDLGFGPDEEEDSEDFGSQESY